MSLLLIWGNIHNVLREKACYETSQIISEVCKGIKIKKSLNRKKNRFFLDIEHYILIFVFSL